MEDMNPVLPPELEEIIFCLAIQDDLKANVNLTLIAKRVYEWLKPHIYKIVILHDKKSLFGRPRFTPDQLQKHGKHVRSILFWNDSSGESSFLDPATCLSWCPNVVDVALWHGDTKYDQVLVDTLLSLPITHFSLDLTWFDIEITKDPQHPVTKHISFSNVTHLYLTGIEFEISLPMHKIKGYFPAVTHLALDEHKIRPRQAILDCWGSHLKVLVLFTHLGKEGATRSAPDDPRVVVTTLTISRGFVGDWYDAAVDDSKSFWRKAEREIGRRLEEGGT